MKSLKLIVVTFLVGSFFAFTITTEKAPKKVTYAFELKFPKAKKVKWEKENDTEWEVEFKMNKTEYSANFLEDGTWTETEHEVNKRDIPAIVKSSLLSNFPGFKIEEAEISESKNGTVYEFEIEKDKEEIEVVIDVNGNIVKKTNESKVDKD
ncbi:PepSY-like domain-containing protein [Formosa algae]|uniref:PepSY-like domain-containing protein n=1 Tax=Formosa algae TaxID=225843 RepID=UPI000CCF3B80|nr:PepSY-like domain-containing protein [Formosa algae]PNW27512.1 hypothetical protein BKP44_12935 [Formosa algae]